jgi:hypothetical protein
MRDWRSVRAVVTLLACMSVSGCVLLHANAAPDPSTWSSALALAQSRAATGRFESADTVLATYASLNPGTREALETAYWRALFRMDPTNPHASLPIALAELDGYLADKRPHEHVVEALSIRRVVAQLDGLNRMAANALAQAKDATATAKDAKAQAADARADAAKASEVPMSAEAEIRKLKDDLAKANAELERIRRRLAQPPPPRPNATP